VRRILALVVVLGVAGAGCSGADQITSTQTDDVVTERAAWEALGIDSYAMRYSLRGTTTGPGQGIYDVKVAAGAVISCQIESTWIEADIYAAVRCPDSQGPPDAFLFGLLEDNDLTVTEHRFSAISHLPSLIVYDDPDQPGSEVRVTLVHFDALSPEQAKWEALGIADYRMAYSVHNLNGMGGSPGDGDYEMTVAGGKVISCTVEHGYGGSTAGCNGAVPEPVGAVPA